MKETVKIEQVRIDDRINGKKVVEVLRRPYVGYVRLILEGGRDVIDGYEGEKVVEVEKCRKKETVKIEQVRIDDRINGKKVVEVLRRPYVGYVRLILEGGRDIVDGYEGKKMVEVERKGGAKK